MKNNLRTFMLATALSTLGFSAIDTSYGEEPGFYIKGDLGGQWSHDIRLREFLGEPIAPGSKVELDPGVRVGVAGGYQFTPWFALEAETGVFGNEIHSVTGATRLHDAWFGNVPFLGNAKLTFSNRSPFTPYIGAGAGFSVSILDVGRLSIMDTQGGETSIHGTDSDAVFAWQAFGGLRYRINDRMGVSVEYRYFWADSPTWHADFTFNTLSDRISFGHSQTHAISAAFDFRF